MQVNHEQLQANCSCPWSQKCTTDLSIDNTNIKPEESVKF